VGASLILSGKGGRGVIRGGWLVAEVAALGGKPAEKAEEDLLGLGLAGEPLEAGSARLGQEQAILIAEHDGLAERPILVFLELELTEIVFRLLAVVPEPEAMPERLGWLSTVTDPPATLAKACMCIANA
jgi:hypothetical protein